MLWFAVVAEPFAVVADDDDGAWTSRLPLEDLDQPAELGVHRGNFAEVRLLRVARPETARQAYTGACGSK